jgi:hypothetical protein
MERNKDIKRSDPRRVWREEAGTFNISGIAFIFEATDTELGGRNQNSEG